MFENLRKIRIAKGITVKEIAKAIGVETEAAYYKKESGLTKFSLAEAKIISDLFEMSIETIFFANKVAILETKQVSAM